MKTVLAVLFSSSVAFAACPKGTEPYSGGCAAMPSPAESALAPMIGTSVVSDEKPPQEKMPSYQREGIHADEPQSLIAQDAKADQERDQATLEGKKAAGIK